MNWLPLLLGAVAAFFLIRLVWQARPGLPLAEARAALEAGTAVLIDVREPAEWAAGVAKQSALLPLSDLRGERTQWGPFLKKNKGRQLLLYCASGTRSGMAAAQLRREGHDAVNAGSLSAWSRTGWPVGAPARR